MADILVGMIGWFVVMTDDGSVSRPAELACARPVGHPDLGIPLRECS
jgi:hypothetical protein